MQRQKSVKKSVTLPAHQEEWLCNLRDSRPGADFSSVLQSIIAGAMERPDPLSRTILTDLVAKLHPNWLPKLETALVAAEPRTQPELLLEAMWLIIEYLNHGGSFRGDFDPFVYSSSLPRTAMALSRCRYHHFQAAGGLGMAGKPHEQREVLADLLASTANVIDLDGTGKGEDLAPVIAQARELLIAAKKAGGEDLVMVAESDGPKAAGTPRRPAGVDLGTTLSPAPRQAPRNASSG